MHKYIRLIFLVTFALVCSPVSGQNLVTNPGFELLNNCPTGRSQIEVSPNYDYFPTALDWISPINTTPDYFSKCGTDSSIKIPYLRYDGFHEPRNGQACAGIAVFSGAPKNIYSDYWSEFVETRLASPLIAGHDYYVCYYVSLAYHARQTANIIAMDRIGARITANRTDTFCTAPMFIMKGIPDIESPPGLFITDTASWSCISGIFHATGGEQWLTVGRFYTDPVQVVTLYNPTKQPDSIHSTCYLLLDDVCVIDMINPSGTDTVIYAPDFPIVIGQGRPAGKYRWENGDTSLETKVYKTGTYIRNRWTECGYYADSFIVTDMAIESCLWLPNAFTPDGDGKNDKFGPGNQYCDLDLQNFNLSIFNRWGQLVYKTETPGDKWDGTYNGKPAEMGVYFYALQYTYGGKYSNSQQSAAGINLRRGEVTLLR